MQDLSRLKELGKKYQGKYFFNKYKGQFTKIIKIVEINNTNHLYMKMLVDMVVDGNVMKNKHIFVTPEWFNSSREIDKFEFLKHMNND